MTTNVFDVQATIVASDSRWSFTLKSGDHLHAIVYADDTGFDKLVVAEGVCAHFAGLSTLIHDWKEWIASPNKVVLNRPPVIEDFAMCIINSKTGNLIFEHGQKITDEKYRFAGTGAKFAYDCWKTNKSALKCVASASLADNYSGGEVKYFNVTDQSHNVSEGSDYSLINKAIFEKGTVMYPVYEGKKISIEEAASADPKVKQLMQQIASGEAKAQAPSGRDPVVWTETDVRRLDQSLNDFFGLSK
jgi:hypothetical protein